EPDKFNLRRAFAWRHSWFTFPLCRLTIDDRGASLVSSFRWLPFVPNYEFEWGQVSSVDEAPSLFAMLRLTRGVRFRFKDRIRATRRGSDVDVPAEAKRAIFWCRSSSFGDVLEMIPPQLVTAGERRPRDRAES